MKWISLFCCIRILVGALQGESAEESLGLHAKWKLTPATVQEGEWLMLEGEVIFPIDLQWNWNSFLEDFSWNLDPLSPRWYVRNTQVGEPVLQEAGQHKQPFSLQILANGDGPYTLFGLQMHFSSPHRQALLPIQIVEVPLQSQIHHSVETESLLPLMPQTFFQVFQADSLSPPPEDMRTYLANRTVPWVWVIIVFAIAFGGIIWRSSWKKIWKDWVDYERKESKIIQLHQLLAHLETSFTTTEEFYTACKYIVRKSSSPSLDVEKKIDYILFSHTIPSKHERAEDLKRIKAIFIAKEK